MFVETMIFDRQHRLCHSRRDGRQRNRPALFAFPGNQRRQHRRVENEPLTCLVAEFELQHAVGGAFWRRRFARGRCARGSRSWPLKNNLDELPVELRASRHQRDSAGAHGEFTGTLRRRPLGVAKIIQAIDQLPIGQRLPASQFERPCQDARQGGLAFAVKPLVDQPREADVIVGGEKTANHQRNRQGKRRHPHPALSPDADDANLQPCYGRFRW